MTIKPLFDALMKMLYRKNVITQEELNEYLIASEKSKGSSSADLVISAIDRIGRVYKNSNHGIDIGDETH